MSKKCPALTVRADIPWIEAIDDLAVLLKLGNRSRVVDLAVELLAAMAEAPALQPRMAYPENPITERFTLADKGRLLENAKNVTVTSSNPEPKSPVVVMGSLPSSPN